MDRTARTTLEPARATVWPRGERCVQTGNRVYSHYPVNLLSGQFEGLMQGVRAEQAKGAGR